MKNKIINMNKYVIIIIYVNDVINNIIKTIYFTMKMHFINDLKINIFLKTNIITFQNIIVNLKIRIVKLDKC